MKKLHVIAYSLIVAGLMASSISYSQMADSQWRKGAEFGTEFPGYESKLHGFLQQLTGRKSEIIAKLDEKIAKVDTMNHKLAEKLQTLRDKINNLTEEDISKFEANVRSAVDQFKKDFAMQPNKYKIGDMRSADRRAARE